MPRGRHGLSHTFVVEHQRGRLLRAIAAACTAKSYPEVTIKDITDGAGVSRRTFYDLFSDKEDCFVAAYGAFVETAFTAMGDAYASAGRSWPDRVGAALATLLELCAANPADAHLAIVDVHAAGRAALARRDATLRRFAVFLEPGRGELPSAIATHELLTGAVIGGLFEALYNRIKAGETERLPELGRELHYCALVPFLGHAKALAASEPVGGTPSRDPIPG